MAPIKTYIKSSTLTTDVIDLVETPDFARRAPLTGETEESDLHHVIFAVRGSERQSFQEEARKAGRHPENVQKLNFHEF